MQRGRTLMPMFQMMTDCSDVDGMEEERIWMHKGPYIETIVSKWRRWGGNENMRDWKWNERRSLSTGVIIEGPTRQNQYRETRTKPKE